MEGVATRQEQQARTWWTKAGRTVFPADRTGRTALIVCTSTLADALATLLSEQSGITVYGDTVCRDPAVDGSGEVIPLAGRRGGEEVVVPLLPGQLVCRVYPQRKAPGAPLSDVLEEVRLADEDALADDGWLAAEVIADRLSAVLDRA
jgi:hypothetical protein